MGYDTECDLIVEAREDQPQVKLNLLKERNALLAEHLGCDRAKVEEALERSGGSMTGASDLLRRDSGRSLRPVALRELTADEELIAESDRSEEHTSELQSLMRISSAVFCLKKKTTQRSTRDRSSR